MAGYSPVIYRFVRWAVKTFFFGMKGGLVTKDEASVPSSGGVILAPNHVSHLDPPAACCALRRTVHCMAKEELFHHRLFGWLITALGAFPVKRGEADTDSIRMSISLLEQGKVVLLFPEGSRGDAKTMLPINRGVAMLAKRTGVPVVPVGIVGTHLVMPRGHGIEKGRHPMVVACGKPFTYAEVATGKNERENREIFAIELQRRIAQVCAENGLPLRTDDSASAPPTASHHEPGTEAPASEPA